MGFILALGAPVGWLVLRAVTGRLTSGLGDEIADNGTLYGYLLVATAAVFSAVLGAVGHAAGRLQRANGALAQRALTDPLTGLRNRRYFDERLLEETARARREGTPLGLLIIDLDHFKRVNDAHGHRVGDEVLTAVARLAATSVRAGDRACRIGGEELGVICPNTELDSALLVAERIRQTIGLAPVRTTAGEIQVTVSIGVAIASGNPDPGALFEAADAAMYAAKTAGRDQVAVAPGPALAPDRRTPSNGEIR